ncbi:hypothetical protein [Streptomyces sp. IBSBF 2806]|uniref:hypothetical protein n=1 Tax=Streptomyces sp. IBSBF 2806 TaxID=2903529 RepID=UPI002FDC4D33
MFFNRLPRFRGEREGGNMEWEGGSMVNREATVEPEGPAVAWGWFLGWLAVGACAGAGLAALLSVGVVLLLLAAVAAGFLLWQSPRNSSVGLLAGLAVPLFYLAYLNRSGPGTVCRTVADGQTCTDEYAPVPFLAAAVILFCAGFLIFLVLRRGSRGTGTG